MIRGRFFLAVVLLSLGSTASLRAYVTTAAPLVSAQIAILDKSAESAYPAENPWLNPESRNGLLCHNDPVNKTDPDGLKDAGVNDDIMKRAEDAAKGFGSYLRGVARGVNALAGLSGIKGDQAQAEQKQAIADISSVGKMALGEPKVAAKITAEVLKEKMQNKPGQVIGRALTGALAAKISVPVGGGYAVPLGAITTPLAMYGDAAHMAVTLRQTGQTLGAEHLLDSILTGGTK